MTARELNDIFIDILDRAKALDPVNTREWFDRLIVTHFNNGSLEIGCPDEATVQYLRDNCKENFTRAAQQSMSVEPDGQDQHQIVIRGD